MKFKVGDKVRLTKDVYLDIGMVEGVGFILRTEDIPFGDHPVPWPYYLNGKWPVAEDELELVE